jgi:hypothetical protein
MLHLDELGATDAAEAAFIGGLHDGYQGGRSAAERRGHGGNRMQHAQPEQELVNTDRAGTIEPGCHACAGELADVCLRAFGGHENVGAARENLAISIFDDEAASESDGVQQIARRRRRQLITAVALVEGREPFSILQDSRSNPHIHRAFPHRRP